MTTPVLESAPECPACNGGGEEGFNVTWDQDPQCDDSRPCAECDGTGAMRLPDVDSEAEHECDRPWCVDCGERDAAARADDAIATADSLRKGE